MRILLGLYHFIGFFLIAFNTNIYLAIGVSIVATYPILLKEYTNKN